MVVRKATSGFPEGWAKGSRQAALAGKRFNCKTDPFTLLVMKILEEQKPIAFRSIRIQKEAIRTLQECAEKHLISVLEGVAIFAEHAGRKAPIKKDFETLESLRPYVK
ncbi:uncharacterized protein B0J16DRAFT_371433 [Fusarium flagelliforme]|uniref:Histone n=1 Tax=Fusarium flagelliforme TaxID=2675880 RepID=A0A395MR53_9HYPO|nr:uncharacterized protein B0J16DRAFT_371433 [Fusarium flagelliforme]KAH7189620.1 hypothetical protein B0J16DRAFT_371433 [Fusarium flagelliforme]RFN50270.1 hypothetical protein FIE12Z_5449 [Fusarium flagelliforme]